MTDIIEPLTQFGVAGLMGVLWIWERHLSRQRERQLSEAHVQLIKQSESLNALLAVVERNTAALERFDQTQKRLVQLLERINHEERKRVA